MEARAAWSVMLFPAARWRMGRGGRVVRCVESVWVSVDTVVCEWCGHNSHRVAPPSRGRRGPSG
eukprot:2868819-Prymnesium_polylepis.1